MRTASRPARPPRPPFPNPPKSSDVADVTKADSQSAAPSSEAEGVAPDPRPQVNSTRCCDLLTDPCSPSTSTCGSQTHPRDQSPPAAAPSERPRPRPRTKLGRRPIRDEVKVQTLVKLREDSLATLAARSGSDSPNPEGGRGKYLQELLEAFSSDDWGLPDHRDDSSEGGQSESEEEEEEEDMATLRARIQAFEQHSSGDDNRQTGPAEGFVAAERPEPRPRPRLQGQPAKSAPPVIAPKPKNHSPTPKPSSKEFWEGEDPSAETTKAPPAEPSHPEPPITPKPQPAAETPVPAPRPPPPKTTNPKPPPRPAVAPRASLGSPQQDRSSVEPAGTEPGEFVTPCCPLQEDYSLTGIKHVSFCFLFVLMS